MNSLQFLLWLIDDSAAYYIPEYITEKINIEANQSKQSQKHAKQPIMV